MKNIFAFLILFLNVYLLKAQVATPQVVSQFRHYYESNAIDSIYYLFSLEMKAAVSAQGSAALINQIKSKLGKIADAKFNGNPAPGVEEYRLTFEEPIVEIALMIKNNLIGGIQQKAPISTDKKITEQSPDNFSVNSDGMLYGTLRIPASEKKTPVVLMIAGSGPTDRNMNQGNALQTNSFLMLSDSLAQNGIASLRYDKRGVGKSMNSARKELVLDDYVNDAILFIEKLKSDGRFSKIIVVGHSEGSLIGLLASIKVHPDAFISLSGPADGVVTILREQLKSSLNASDFEIASRVLKSLENGKTTEQALPSSLESLFTLGNQKFMISSDKTTSATEIKKLKIPTLIIGGTTDLQVNVDQARKLSKLSTSAKLNIIKGMNHVLKESSAERKANSETYNQPKLGIHKELAKDITKFIEGL